MAGMSSKFDPAKDMAGSDGADDIEMSPEELAERPAPALSSLPEIVRLSALTFDHIHALLALFKRSDEKESGLSEEAFCAVFEESLSQALGRLGPVFQQLAKIDASKTSRVFFADFVDFVCRHAKVDGPQMTAFRTEGVTLAGDDDTPLHSRLTRQASLPPISEMSKMGLLHMQALLNEFKNDESGDFDMDEFVEHMSEVMPGMTEEALEAVFMKVDANSDGSVSWDEFSNYILAAGNASDANASKQEGGALLEGPEPDLNREIMHGMPISHMCCHRRAERYISVALEDRGSATRDPQAVIRMWSSRPEIAGEYLIPTAKLCGVSAQVMCLCVFDMRFEWRTGPPVYVLAVSSVDGRIRFFDLDKLTQLGELDLLNAICTSMTSFNVKDLSGGGTNALGDSDADSLGVFAWGDDKGDLYLISQSSVMQACRRGTYLTPSTAFVKMSLSEQWISQLLWLEDMELLVVTDHKGHIKILEGREPGRESGSARRPLALLVKSPGQATLSQQSDVTKLHSLGVKALCWCEGSKAVATAGLDRSIQLWEPNPFRSIGQLEGHKKAVVALEYKTKQDILVSLDYRSCLMFWDAANLVCLMKLEASAAEVAQQRAVTTMLISPGTGHLVLGKRKPQLWRFCKIQEAGVQRELYHKGPLVAVLVNPCFYQLVVVDTTGLVTLWELGSGRQVSNFYAEGRLPHETASNAQFTSPDFRRLLVSFSQGSTRMYNFSNGSIIQDFVSDATGPIFNTMVIEKEEKGSKSGSKAKEHFLLSSGWNGAVWLYRLNSDDQVVHHFQKLVPKNSKTPLDEIASFAFHAPSTLITGRRDGHLLVWNTITYALLADHCLEEGTRVKETAGAEAKQSKNKHKLSAPPPPHPHASSSSPAIIPTTSTPAAPMGKGSGAGGSRRLSASRTQRPAAKDSKNGSNDAKNSSKEDGPAFYIHNGIPEPTSPRAQQRHPSPPSSASKARARSALAPDPKDTYKDKRRPPHLQHAHQYGLRAPSVGTTPRAQAQSAAAAAAAADAEERSQWADLDRLLAAAGVCVCVCVCVCVFICI